jgi:hypothetical protein
LVHTADVKLELYNSANIVETVVMW